jgi:hypothetical protein
MTDTLNINEKTNFVRINNTKEIYLNKNDVEKILNSINLSRTYELSEVKAIFDILDKEKVGKILKTDLIEYIKVNINRKDSHSIEGYLISNSEKAIQLLKNLSKKFELSKDTEAIEDINWIINCFVNGTWDEIDMLKKGEVEKNETDTIKMYSNAEQNERKKTDINKVHTKKNLDKMNSYTGLNNITVKKNEKSISDEANSNKEEFNDVKSRKNLQRNR